MIAIIMAQTPTSLLVGGAPETLQPSIPPPAPSTSESSSAKPSGGPGAAASLHGAEWNACAWPFLDAVSGRCWYAMVSVHIVPQSSRVPSVHIWAEPEWWKKKGTGDF